jgi:hypothetical protein
MDMVEPRRPGEYAATGRQDALRGPTPRPTSAAGEVPVPQVDRHVAAFIEGVLTEGLAQLESRMSLRHETRAMAEMSGKLLEAEETVKRASKRAQKSQVVSLVSTSIALVLVIAIGVVSQWARQLFSEDVKQAAAVAIEQKAVPLEDRVAAAERASADTARVVRDLVVDVQAVADSIQALRNDLEPPVKVHVPQQRKRPQ